MIMVEDMIGWADGKQVPGTAEAVLDKIGIRNGVKQASNARDLLGQHEVVLRSLELEITDIVLILGVDAVGTANTFAEFLPAATIHLLSVHPLDDRRHELAGNVRYSHCASIADRIDYLKECNRPQVIIEDGNNRKSQKLACFRQLFLFLPPGGVYAVEELRAITLAQLDDCSGDNIVELLNRLNLLRLSATEPEQRDDAELAHSIASISFGTNVAYIRKRHEHWIKLRQTEANAVLAARFSDRWGRVLKTLPAYQYKNAATVINHGDGPLKDRRTIKVPERYLRRYNDVVCLPRQRVSLDGYYLPDSFRHPLQSRLNHRVLVNSTPVLGRPVREMEGRLHLDGTYFYFDTEYPGHFGHVMTEVIGRYWGWVAARELDPDIRPLVSLDPGADEIPGFQKLIFEALDVPIDEIAYVPPLTSVEVESLVAASPGFAMPQYADAGLKEVWSRIADRLAQPGLQVPELLFASRRPRRIRTCLNAPEVEAFFADKGFRVIYPEDFSLNEQVTMFSGARVIAGFGGSNMFCTMFAPQAIKIIISGESYTANNEQLIAAVVGGEVHNVWGRSEIKHPKTGWAWPAFQSNFTMDLPMLRSAVASVLAG